MDTVNRIVLVDHKDHLQQATTAASTPDEPFVILPVKGIGSASVPDHHFGFIGAYSVHGKVPCSELII